MAGAEREKKGVPSADGAEHSNSFYLQKFFLFETCSNFYMIGRDKTKSYWRVLKIGRLEPSELNIVEDPTVYTEQECVELLKRLREGNKLNGGLKLVTSCYGIIGFIKFLGPYYMLLITKREKIGAICGHPIYTVTNTKMIPIPSSSVLSDMALSKDEKRYKKLLRVLDLRKDFFFSYSYNIMCSVQKNLCDNETGQILHETMFVWNAYLTREIRNNLRSNLWTVALVYGFFKQVKLSVVGKHFNIILIARRSRHYAGTRYLKRGVNERGRVANDVETEQIVTVDGPEGCPIRISSVVQHRGSIPLFWSQESSPLNLRPDIILSEKDPEYEASRLHFENLSMRYGNPIVILSLIKTCEPKPRESPLNMEFLKAVRFLNKGLSNENKLKFFHLDLHKYSRSRRATHALSLLLKTAKHVLTLTGLFYRELTDFEPEKSITLSSKKIDSDSCTIPEIPSRSGDENIFRFQGSNSTGDDGAVLGIMPMMRQNGVLRTNCIDCIDRTNVAQYAFGLVALGRQLHVLGLLGSPEIDFDNPLAEDLMGLYETMGDTLALQYGGSAAHNKIFSETRGQWKPATQSQELFRTVHRYISNAYTDPEKQDAINLFLGYFQPHLGKPAIWELDSDQHRCAGRQSPDYDYRNASSFIKRSFSDGNILSRSDVHQAIDIDQNPLPGTILGGTTLADSLPQIFVCEHEISRCRSIASTQPLEGFSDEPGSDRTWHDEYEDDDVNSDFIDLEWLSSLESLYKEDAHDRGPIFGKLTARPGSTSKEAEWTRTAADKSVFGFSDNFIRWVAEGGTVSVDNPKA